MIIPSSRTVKATISMLSRTNLSILNQKLLLMDTLRNTFGIVESKDRYKQICPIVRASIGQHVRHSMDHIELAVQAAASVHGTTTAIHRGMTTTMTTGKNNNNNNNNNNYTIHYDVRSRGGPEEYDMDMAEQRILRIMETLSNLSSNDGYQEEDIEEDDDNDHLAESQQQQQEQQNTSQDGMIDACFILSSSAGEGGGGGEFRLPTTILRELGFAAHHAIHHMALVKIIVHETLQLPDNTLPMDFGRAPSTVIFDNNKRR